MATTVGLVLEIKTRTQEFERSIDKSKQKVDGLLSPIAKVSAAAGTMFVRAVSGTGRFVLAIGSAGVSLSKLIAKISGVILVATGMARALSAVRFLLAGGLVVSLALVIRQLGVVTDRLDLMIKSSRALGTTVNEFQKISFAAELAGVPVEQLSASLRFMNRTIGETATGVGAAGPAFEKLGLRAEYLVNLPIAEQFERIRQAISRVGSEAERKALAAKFFAAEGVFAFNKLISGAAEANREFDELGLGINDQQAKAVEAFQDSRIRIGALFGDFQNKIIAYISPAFTELLDKLKQTIIQYGGVDAAAKLVADNIIKGTTAVIEWVKKMYEEYKAGFPALAELKDNITATFAVITDVITSATHGIREFIKYIDAVVDRSERLGKSLSRFVADNNDRANFAVADQLARGEIDAGQARREGLSATVIQGIEGSRAGSSRDIATQLGARLGSSDAIRPIQVVIQGDINDFLTATTESDGFSRAVESNVTKTMENTARSVRR